ncbi:McbB family protein [Paenibacillus sp. p3-SID867]|uniref:McbB family protein n=1 Tax=Paenibacillus sp. p3-SID867 TaxID=2916363 RepID=UPI0021A7AD6D|nr:McbB family protein [Paenibacillus sp. p3-SID867]MCT1398562.1 McbB family protein [Paenibacillus sp. p3-SID867]
MLETKNKEGFQVGNFIYHILPNENMVLQNKHGIVNIQNAKMIDVIKKLDKMTNNKIDKEYLEVSFGEYTEEAINFLLQYGIIQNFHKKNYNINCSKFFTNHKEFRSFINSINTSSLDISLLDKPHIKSNDFVMVFLNPYDKKLAEEIVKEIKGNKNSILLMSYIYNNKFYVDSPYCSDWKSPCHFCHMGHIESQLRISDTNELTYQQLVDILYHEDNKFKVEYPLEIIEIINITKILFDLYDKFILRKSGFVIQSHESLHEINECISFDLRTKIKTKDIGIHWEMCDCYE